MPRGAQGLRGTPVGKHWYGGKIMDWYSSERDSIPVNVE